MNYYYILDKLIKEAINKEHTVVIYPLGKIGLQAKDILNNRYGRTGIVIDNFLAQYNKDIVDINSYCEKLDRPNTTIILCTSNHILYENLLDELKKKKIKGEVRGILEQYAIVTYPEKAEYFKRIKSLCRVKKAVGYELVRVGSRYDGGYVMLNDFENKNIAYSFGIGHNTDWDEGIADFGIDVFCYDHTINQLFRKHSKLHFNKIGIAGIDCIENNLLSMESILCRNNHKAEKNLILKMDVEGAEWEFINLTSLNILNQFSQITFELHELTNIENSVNILAALEKMNRTHQVVWVHANNNNGAEQAEDIIIPRLLEITYANKEQYTFETNEYNCPLDIDERNIEEQPDIELINWGS